MNGSFSERIQHEVSSFEAERDARQARERDMHLRRVEHEAKLELARSRMRQVCREAAEYLCEKGLPTERAKVTVPLNGFSVKGYSSPPTKFKTVVFPEGWVIARSTDGDASDVLSLHGRWLTVGYSTNAAGKAGKIREYPYHLYDSYAEDENGPYITLGDNTPLDGYESTDPPPSLEGGFMRMIAGTIATET